MANYRAIGGGNPSGMHNYSTEEQIIGTWIDGKTAYEKTFYYSSGGITQGTSYHATGGLLIDTLISITGRLQGGTNRNPIPFNDPRNPIPNYGIGASYENGAGIVINTGVAGYASYPFSITIQYTKS